MCFIPKGLNPPFGLIELLVSPEGKAFELVPLLLFLAEKGELWLRLALPELLSLFSLNPTGSLVARA